MNRKCITVYTQDFDTFSNIYEDVINTAFLEDEEKQFEGVTATESGEVPPNYLEKMRNKKEVAIMYIRDRDITIMQHGEVFEILMPS